MKGFIKIHRTLSSWQWYTEPNTFRVFIHLLLLATHKQSKWHDVELLPGQLITGRFKLSQDLKLTERVIRTALKRLKTTNEIAIKTTNKFSIITICNWATYQDTQTDERPTKRPTISPANDQQTTTFKNVKNIEDDIYIIFDEFRKQYPGIKRGLETELNNFLKKNEKERIHLLMPALEMEKKYKSEQKLFGEFVPSWKNLSTWINARCWEQEFSDVKKSTNGQTRKISPIEFKEKSIKSVYELNEAI